ncbi:hypothetical protein GGX14DRAFT_636323 [Mycena pura]|uniref:Uncharacterized protein n=1 Tax=Mycena pura TaxID=153505 RepID=A0AAD6YFH2_9AGAR|nr:hypothetical protein GGX14DRAFT_636323 [Mycena pura]
MLPFALKLVWCVLCSLGELISRTPYPNLKPPGTIASWTTIMALGSLPGPMWWATLSFCIALTILEGIFCLGMIWRMDPFAMPRAFCVAQTILMEASIFALGGINTAGCIATSLHVLKPKKWGDITASFKWRPIYIIPAVLCPVIASAIQITLVFKFDAIQPADDMHCDAIDPLWVRLVAHVMSIVLFFPTVYLSVTSWRRVARTVKHVERALDDNGLHQIRRERPNEHHSPGCQFIEPALPEQATNASTRKLPFFRHLHSISQPLRPPLLSPSPIEDDDERIATNYIVLHQFHHAGERYGLRDGQGGSQELRRGRDASPGLQ